MVSKEKKVSKKERQEKMRKLIVLLGVMIILTGCSKETKVETPPWSEKQQEQWDDEDVSVPILKIKF
jgi:PBP1b-binding outer membrane lipoprotein LpoB